jgi:hypothetical protein
MLRALIKKPDNSATRKLMTTTVSRFSLRRSKRLPALRQRISARRRSGRAGINIKTGKTMFLLIYIGSIVFMTASVFLSPEGSV